MATVRIAGNWRSVHKMELAGAPAVSDDGRIERSVPIPEEAYAAIERQIAHGAREGIAVLPTGTRFEWFLDGSLPARAAAPAPHPPKSEQGFDRLRRLLPEVERLARGEFDGSAEQANVIRLLALVVAEAVRGEAGR
jgi:hypothetical protein